MDNILALIPARGGSKGIPRKNVQLLAGKPLIAWTIEEALSSRTITRVIVTTDDDEIASVARDYGAEVPFKRPTEYAQDHSPDIDVYKHTMRWLEEQQEVLPNLVVWLRPTTPLRTSGDIDEAIHLLRDNDGICLRSVCLVEHHPYWMKKVDGVTLSPFIAGKDERIYYQRQLLPPVYRLNGAVDITRPRWVMEHDYLYDEAMLGYVMPESRSIDIDTHADFLLAEHLLNNQPRSSYA